MNSEFRLDWLGFTFKPTPENFSDFDLYNLSVGYDNGNLLDAFYSLFPEIHDFILSCSEDLIKFRPGNHYQVAIDACDYFCISFDESSHALDKGLNIQVPSHGLEKFFEIMKIDFNDSKKAVYNMVHLLYDRCCQLSRIDLCLDDYTKMFRPHDYEAWFTQGIISHNFSSRAFFHSSNGAETLYFGKMRSDKFLRIYDKFLESNGKIDSVRYEFELHGRPLKQLALFLLENEFDFGKYLLSWFKVHDPEKLQKNETNKSKCPILPEWEKWLELEFSEVPTPIKIPSSKSSESIDSLLVWKKTCNWALFTAMTLSGADPLDVLKVLNIDYGLINSIPVKYKRILRDNNVL